MLHRLWPLALALWTGCASPRAVVPPSPTSDEKPLPPLPRVFGDLKWTTTAAELRARFPKAVVAEDEPFETFWKDEVTGRPLVDGGFTVNGAELAPLGRVEVVFEGFQGRASAAIAVHRKETVECWPDGVSEEEGQACSDRQEEERRAAYEQLAGQLTALYGEGTLHHLESNAAETDADPIEPGQAERCWTPTGLRVCLALGIDPRTDFTRTVRLLVVRDDRMRW
ncbi:hypothetical protein FGE12_04695 [Aggregicoccus sp. 17bor-14]|uniref:hypothetical protein n=1 Tax=Myxococcaceae TaxID=31 RepID=UPI00129C4B49|nr:MULTISPECIES: hypothetical protein [Myxococcaceae]MBF5041678.1 hypothetical protein [Simulacricoccus sp. 17bor-14]MRI87460.1 hypothetical protein [Aggregicoccus sp. 17bor-14]